ncbi:hypothetical protein M951_chr366 (nucleomorph) [Lotharella oceanica]|uniref:Uncharacterized protein n=1 Tax=Lotharella oceanica TaxID=641309 RepID=A0A060DB76_9EUKA|nr:hypothetical protein M951_chr366 [Lotharella oceanica]|mmetsp:Transcript_2893/g.5588  ORF Transcript_2893/g.5588 Transcript_2893/m.5588 type:complete len:145 (-) Transcript_2893:1287-1721(-)
MNKLKSNNLSSRINENTLKTSRSKNIYNYEMIMKNEFKNYNKIFLRSIKHKKISELVKYILIDSKYDNFLLNNHRFCQQFIEEERNKIIKNRITNHNNYVILINYWYHEKFIDQIMLHFKYKNILIFMNELQFYDCNIKTFHIY